MDFLHKIEAVIVLDNEGQRLLAKYYPTTGEPSDKAAGGAVSAASSRWGSFDKQRKLETSLNAKVRDPKRPSSSDVELFVEDGHVAAVFAEAEVTFIVVGSADENEFVLLSVLQCFMESLQTLLKSTSPGKRLLLEKYDTVLLVLDEMIDDGIILEQASGFVVGDVTPFEVESSTDGARKVMTRVQKLITQSGI